MRHQLAQLPVGVVVFHEPPARRNCAAVMGWVAGHVVKGERLFCLGQLQHTGREVPGVAESARQDVTSCRGPAHRAGHRNGYGKAAGSFPGAGLAVFG